MKTSHFKLQSKAQFQAVLAVINAELQPLQKCVDELSKTLMLPNHAPICVYTCLPNMSYLNYVIRGKDVLKVDIAQSVLLDCAQDNNRIIQYRGKTLSLGTHVRQITYIHSFWINNLWTIQPESLKDKLKEKTAFAINKLNHIFNPHLTP